MDSLTIATPQNFNFQQCLAFLNRNPQECLFKIEKGRISLFLKIKEERAVIEISDSGNSELYVGFLNGSSSFAFKSGVQRYIENWFDLDRDISPFIALSQSDKILIPLIKRYDGLRLIGIPNFFEAICWAIIGQQINLNFAYTLKKRLVEKYGHCCEFSG
jgi:DNA-3-methyladenine glycosylase II